LKQVNHPSRLALPIREHTSLSKKEKQPPATDHTVCDDFLTAA
jgi:hypothetical protein